MQIPLAHGELQCQVVSRNLSEVVTQKPVSRVPLPASLPSLELCMLFLSICFCQCLCLSSFMYSNWNVYSFPFLQIINYEYLSPYPSVEWWCLIYKGYNAYNYEFNLFVNGACWLPPHNYSWTLTSLSKSCRGLVQKDQEKISGKTVFAQFCQKGN